MYQMYEHENVGANGVADILDFIPLFYQLYNMVSYLFLKLLLIVIFYRKSLKKTDR